MEDFGTHIAREISFGSKATYESDFTQEGYSSFQSKKYDFSVSAKASFMLVIGMNNSIVSAYLLFRNNRKHIGGLFFK